MDADKQPRGPLAADRSFDSLNLKVRGVPTAFAKVNSEYEATLLRLGLLSLGFVSGPVG